jgi:hypothetical protein
VLERFDNEALDPAIERTFNIMLRAGLLPPIPAGAARPAREARVHLDARPGAEGRDDRRHRAPGVLRGPHGRRRSAPTRSTTIDWDEAIDQYADMMGVPEKIVRAHADVMKLRAAARQGAAAQQAMQMGLAAVQGAKVMSETDVGGGRNALQAMTQ